MSTTQDAPADTRTPAQDYEVHLGNFRSYPAGHPGELPSLSAMVEAIHSEVDELRESKAKITLLVQEQALALAEQATDLKALRERVAQLTGTAPEPAPTIETLIAEIEAGGWEWALYGYASPGHPSVVQIYDRETGVVASVDVHDSAVAALQKALDKARQAVQS